ncbi:malonate decarboxylase, alpha subunit [Salmonella enterica subsp. arizonae]|uniref:Malonate decarboxylase, alpha subunit n=1 Tax=Salmonella enterica subsp. arizonae TaxID=59203 RepID=A0A3S4GHV0_SALER|nr:malonate decarboxylase, alpha subunit [Salmonella enterica subsp. arizonae]
MLSGQTPARVWNTRRNEKQRRLASVPVQGKVLPTADLTAMLEKLIAPGDRVVLEGITKSRRISCPVCWRKSIRRKYTTCT